MPSNGNFSQVNAQRGMLEEYANTDTPLRLEFEFNPTTITRTRSITLRTGGSPGTRGGYDFQNRSETVRAAQGVTVNAESFTVKILLDATDRMNAGDAQAEQHGVQPELDVIRSMIEPKVQTPEGARTLSAIQQGDQRAFSRQQYASVLLFTWGRQTLPVFMTQAQIELKEFLPNLVAYRAEATLTLQIIESNNPFYVDELKRQFASAGQSVGPSSAPAGGAAP
jgi:hypothetical protein